MSSSGQRSGERMIHQDFIARIRFSNALPPPPNPPKLLDIPNTGLASGQYTTPGFASRLAREQPLNIEADAELGMPLDLVGMPGVFDGDERSIQAPAQAPTVHPHDRPLLRPIAALGKLKVAEANVSFLRRTEYISSTATKRLDGSNLRGMMPNKKPGRRAPEAAADSPQVIKRKIDRGFDIAEQDLKDPKRVKHPSKKHLKLVSAAPLLPDLDAFPDSGAYVTIKFLTNPVSNENEYDKRLLSGLFKPIDRTREEEQAFEIAQEAYEQDPYNNPRPHNLMNYEFYLGQSGAVAEKFRRKFDVDDMENDDDDLYTHQAADGSGYFQFNKLRAYETAKETELDHPTKYTDEILLAYNDTDEYPRQKAVYYYPIMQKSTIRPQRTKNIARTIGLSQGEEQVVDQLDVTVEDPTEEMLDAMKQYKEHPLGFEAEEEEAPQQDERRRADAQVADADADADGDEDAKDEEHNGGSSVAPPPRTPSEDRDAEDDEDEDEE